MTAGRGTFAQAARGWCVALAVGALAWAGLAWCVVQATRGLG